MLQHKNQVFLARALVAQPKIVLLDETLSTLDHAIRLRVLAYVRQIQATCLIMTHDSQVAALADRVVVLGQP